ncbi:T9SS type A sorting domain-containing protein [Flavivirga eckloniae]|uniref:Uncharacterized protein n=1 Tax=Flavivirga eckloniae TaxID=1803846 RepID=A0A2K9PSY0_9FLAO|nr:T9SS type A sorting domain-containing protein [Flavivirga eckloniae]AUP80165.1 hypothetical protein C1H87_16200 [Flavivirga eckloniae]
MKKTLLFLTLTLLMTSTQFSYGQIKTEYFPEKNGKNRIANIPKRFKATKSTLLPSFNLKRMVDEDSESEGEIKPYRFGKGFDVNIDIKAQDWEEVDDKRIWAMAFESKGAKSINFVFDKLHLIEGAELYIYNDTGSVVYGPVTHLNNLTQGVFLTDLIHGEHVTLYIHEPQNKKESSNLRIKRVVHGYRGVGEMLNGSPGASESCNNNINCFSAWDLQSDAVGLVLLANGTEWCSGSLIMSADQSFRPYFLSAFHCIDTNSNRAVSAGERNAAEDWMFKFQFKYTTCSGTTVASSFTYNDATFRAGWFNTDFLLMELDQSPIGNNQMSLAGWDRGAATPNSGAGIHHPAGDVMKISIENNGFLTSSWNGANNHWRLNFDDGVVQHGSSGSPIFNQDRRIVGQLHGNQSYNSGLSYCAQSRAEYGRFNVSWTGGGTNATRLSNWLDPCGSGATTTNTSRPPNITGSSTVCSNTKYTLNNLPAGSTISWSSSSKIKRVSSQGSNPCTFRNTGSGSGWITATVTPPNGCGNTFQVRRNLSVGGKVDFTWNGTGPYGQVDVSITSGSPPFKIYRASTLLYSGYQSFTTVNFGCNGGPIRVEANTPCGVTSSGTDIVPQGCASFRGQQLMMAHPNPSNTAFNISPKDVFKKAISNEHIGPVTLELYDFSGNLLSTQKFEELNADTKMNVSNLKKGLYVLRIRAKEIDEVHRVIVE